MDKFLNKLSLKCYVLHKVCLYFSEEEITWDLFLKHVFKYTDRRWTTAVGRYERSWMFNVNIFISILHPIHNAFILCIGKFIYNRHSIKSRNSKPVSCAQKVNINLMIMDYNTKVVHAVQFDMNKLNCIAYLQENCISICKTHESVASYTPSLSKCSSMLNF